MKIFLDTANRQQIEKWVKAKIVDGVTTNPTLLSKEDSNTKNVLLDICKMVKGPVSVEVVEKDPSLVFKQAKDIAKLAENVVVKIPCCFQYFSIVDELVKDGIRINITLVFSELQAMFAAKLGVAYISPFIGRLEDIGAEGLNLVNSLMTAKQIYNFKSEIIAASIRNIYQWRQIMAVSVDVVTVPPNLLEQATKHPLTDLGIEMFEADWKKLNKNELL